MSSLDIKVFASSQLYKIYCFVSLNWVTNTQCLNAGEKISLYAKQSSTY